MLVLIYSNILQLVAIRESCQPLSALLSFSYANSDPVNKHRLANFRFIEIHIAISTFNFYSRRHTSRIFAHMSWPNWIPSRMRFSNVERTKVHVAVFEHLFCRNILSNRGPATSSDKGFLRFRLLRHVSWRMGRKEK